jgi:hypothetical protein
MITRADEILAEFFFKLISEELNFLEIEIEKQTENEQPEIFKAVVKIPGKEVKFHIDSTLYQQPNAESSLKSGKRQLTQKRVIQIKVKNLPGPLTEYSTIFEYNLAYSGLGCIYNVESTLQKILVKIASDKLEAERQAQDPEADQLLDSFRNIE